MLFSSPVFLCIFLAIFLCIWNTMSRTWPQNLPWLLLCASGVLYTFFGLTVCFFAIIWLVCTFMLSLLLRKAKQGHSSIPPYMHPRILLGIGLLFNACMLIIIPQLPLWEQDFIPLIQPFTPKEHFMPPILGTLAFMQSAHLITLYTARDDSQHFIPYALSLGGLPHIFAGLLVRPEHMQTQWTTLKEFSSIYAARGISFFVLGLAKKCLLADMLAPSSAAIFTANEQGLPIYFLEAWLGLLSYILQLYFTLSAFADMARGLGLILGIHLPAMFDAPFKARNIRDFWQRWNIPLANWVRDTLYTPLGGKDLGPLRQYAHLYLAMILGSLWYGISLPILFFGLMHALMLSMHQALHMGIKKMRNTSFMQTPFMQHVFIQTPYAAVTKTFAHTLTFIVSCISFVFIGSNSLESAFAFIAALLDIESYVTYVQGLLFHPLPFYHEYVQEDFAICFLGISLICIWFLPTSEEFLLKNTSIIRWHCNLTWAYSMAFLAVLSILAYIVRPQL